MSEPIKPATVPSVDDVVMTPLERPIVIDAIRCRLSQDCDGAERAGRVLHILIPTNELRLIVDILDAARHCVREWEPNATEKARGAGTGVGMRAAEDKLIRVLKRDLAS